MNKISPLLLLLLLAPVASADAISDVNLWIGEDGVTWVEEKVVVEGDGKNSSSVLIPDFIEEVTVSAPEGGLEHAIAREGKYNKVEFRFKRPLASGESKAVWVKFSTPMLTVKTGGNWVVSYYTPSTPAKTIVRVNFPVGSKIVSLEPDDVLRSYDKYALWLYPQNSDIEFKATYEYGGKIPPDSMGTPSSGNETNFTLPSLITVSWRNFTLLIGLLLVVLVVVFGLTFWKRRVPAAGGEGVGKIEYAPPEDFVAEPAISDGSVSYSIGGEGGGKVGGRVKDSIIKMLDDKETAIVKLLEKAGEEVTQAYIYKTTGIPKTSLSDIIRRIEKRNLIETKKEGRTKWIKLKEWILE